MELLIAENMWIPTILTFLVLTTTYAFYLKSPFRSLSTSTSSNALDELLYPETLKWGIYKPHLLFAVAERSINPIVLRTSFTTKASSRPKYDVRDWKGKVFYEFHNGVSFASEKLYLQDAHDFNFNWFKETSNSQSQSWRTFITFNANITEPNIFLISLSAESWIRSQENSKEIRIKGGRLEIFNGEKLIGLLIPRILGCEDPELSEGIKFYGVKGAGSSYYKRVREEMDKAFLEFREESKDGQEPFTAVILKFFIRPSTSCIIDLFYSELPSTSTLPSIPVSLESRENLLANLQRKRENFEKKFDMIFPSVASSQRECSKISLSTLLGGLIYEYGPVFVKETNSYEAHSKPIFSATPCRTAFPRAFLWDEGFHQSVICHFSPLICMSALKSWLQTTWDDGWIPREQIRGGETEEYANKDYLSQTEDEANPPTLLLPLSILRHEMKKGDPILLKFFQDIYPNLKRWFFWFHNKNAVGNQELFRWKERSPGLFLGSGLDDYPRGNSKYHLDLQCWVLFFAQQLLPISKEFDSEGESKKISEIYEEAKSNLFTVFLDKDGLMKDVTEAGFSPHLGYITILPLALGFLESDSAEFNSTLAFISDPSSIFSQFGIRSLSKKDEYFGTGENYWRGRIWIPFNYLLLRGLKLFYCKNSKAMQIYEELKQNVLNNVCQRFDEEKFFFENYESETGKGSYNRPFNGWTSLITLIESEKY